MNAINQSIKEIIDNGSYYVRPYGETISQMQTNMGINQYHYSISAHNGVFHFTHKTGTFEMPVSDFEWKILWDKFGDVPINEDEEIDSPFEHFDVGTDRMEIWHWFEWFFDIQLGGNVL